MTPAAAVALQRAAGNAAVVHALRDPARRDGPPTPVQRFTVVQPGDNHYPLKGVLQERGEERRGRGRGEESEEPEEKGEEPEEKGETPREKHEPESRTDEHFPGQKSRRRIVHRPRNKPKRLRSFVGADGTANIVYKGDAPLRLAANLDLAIEDTGSRRQAKTFFATLDRIDEANERLKQLKGELSLARTQKYLAVRRPGRPLILWQVEPVASRYSASREETIEQRGLDARFAQRCDSIAASISGLPAPEIIGERRYADAVADLLGGLSTGRSAKRSAKRSKRKLDEARREGARGAGSADALTRELGKIIRKIMVARDDPARKKALTELYAELGLNQFTPGVSVGDLYMIKALDRKAASGEVDYHFATVVATSGPDHVTMENYARHEEEETLSSGDPQWYFQMYGPQENNQSFHQQWGWEERFVPGSKDGNRLVLTLLLHR
ncbi:hypothetical protein [Streptomyces sp. B6B3]|uniref:hypothetical protein n=1 Tax=Streptomyces sp. B6B3 TaxID=3153570 RepID=UPI00325E2109